MAAGWRMEYPHRYIHLPPGKLGQPNEWPNRPLDSSLVVPLYEVMFEKPVVVEDTFVVAGTYLNNEGSWEWQCEPMWEDNRRMMWLWNHCPTRYIDWKGEAPEPDSRRILWSKFRTAQWQKQIAARMNIYNTFAPFHSPLIFPIIEPGFDTTLCHDTRNIRVADRTDSSADMGLGRRRPMGGGFRQDDGPVDRLHFHHHHQTNPDRDRTGSGNDILCHDTFLLQRDP